MVRSKLSSFGLVLLLLLLPVQAGCGSVSYLLQAGRGQLALVNRARPIDEVLRNEKTRPELKRLLTSVGAVKRFGEEMGLKPTGNYTEYVDLGREYVVWVVSACEELRFKSKEWSFPFFGSFPYLGWFKKENAEEHASELRKEGYDVDVRGASAYSTLGWFRDPLLSSMVSGGESAAGGLVEVVLHESVHATVYLKGQAYFNESVASFIAEGLTPVFLKRQFGEASKEFLAYGKSGQDDEERTKEFHAAYEALNRLYHSARTDVEKRAEKKKRIEKLKNKFKITRAINNATLIQFQTYRTAKPDFQTLLEACGGDWKRFLARLKTLEESAFSKSQDEDLAPVLRTLAKSGC